MGSKQSPELVAGSTARQRREQGTRRPGIGAGRADGLARGSDGSRGPNDVTVDMVRSESAIYIYTHNEHTYCKIMSS